MSNAIRFDSLLLAATGRALSARLEGRVVRGVWIDRRERTLLIRFAARVRRTPDSWLLWNLHPTSGDLGIDETPREPTGSTVQVSPGSTIKRIHALPDERVLCIELDAGDAAAGFARCVYIELIGSRWNAIAAAQDDAIIAVMQLRERNGVQMRPGAKYTPPTKASRAGAETSLTESHYRAALLNAMQRDDDIRKALIHDIAYSSSINATYIVAPIVTRGFDDGSTESYARYAKLLASNDGYVLNEGRGQPYPSALNHDDAQRAADLLDAYAIVGSRTAVEVTAPAGSVEAAMAAVHEKVRRIDERIEKLENESRDAAEESDRMRRHGDLLFAQLHRAVKNANQVELDDFEGGTVTVKLDPLISAKENATKLHEQAKRREHASERVPAMIAKAQAERARLVELQIRLSNAEATSQEIEHWSREATRPRTQHDDAPTLPYRLYRTSSGLEVRVGRNSRANDALTFHHSSPDDIWMHARDYAGAHVVLRWTHRESNPPTRDIEEAASLAAVHSKGRTSGLVPVDWTRRKYVRKRRKAPPGQVIVERSKTLFVQPDAALERKLRDDD